MSPAVEQDPNVLLWQRLEEREQRIARLELTRGKGGGGIGPDSQKVSMKRPDGGWVESNAIGSGGQQVWGATNGDLDQYITPTVNVWWHVEFGALVRIGQASWREVDFYLWMTWGSDVLGRAESPYDRVHTAAGCSPWVSGRAVGLFKLAAGQPYKAEPWIRPHPAATCYQHRKGEWTYSLSQVVGYW